MRSAVINPHTLGAIEAYRMVIEDISGVLGDPVIDVNTLFYASMIQSGIGGFAIPNEYLDKIPQSGALAKRISSIDLAKIAQTLGDLEKQIRSCSLQGDASNKKYAVSKLIYFLQDLYVAAEFGRPVVTAYQVPDIEELRGLLREDLLILVQSLIRSVQTVSIDTPLVRLEMPVQKLKPFQEVIQSDLFIPYVEGHELLASRETESKGVGAIGRTARTLVDTFPEELNLKRTSVAALQAVPAIVEATAGKILGAVAKPIVETISKAIQGERRLLVYSFHPVWRQVWDAKLDKVRLIVQAERMSKNDTNKSS